MSVAYYICLGNQITFTHATLSWLQHR